MQKSRWRWDVNIRGKKVIFFREFASSSLPFIKAVTIKLLKWVSQGFRICCIELWQNWQSDIARLAMLTNDIEPRIFRSIDIFVKRQKLLLQNNWSDGRENLPSAASLCVHPQWLCRNLGGLRGLVHVNEWCCCYSHPLWSSSRTPLCKRGQYLVVCVVVNQP